MRECVRDCMIVCMENLKYIQNSVWAVVWLNPSHKKYYCSCAHYRVLLAIKEQQAKECWHLSYLGKNIESLQSMLGVGDDDVFCDVTDENEEIEKYELCFFLFYNIYLFPLTVMSLFTVSPTLGCH